MSLLLINDRKVFNNDTLLTTDIALPTFSHTDNSDITTLLIYANEGYVQWLKYNEQDIFPFENIVKPGVYTFYQFNSTNLDILVLIEDTTRENLTTKFNGRVFGKLIGKISFNVIVPKSKLLDIPATVTRESLLNNSSIQEIRNVCKSSPDVAERICSSPLFLGDLVNKYLISDLSDAREYAKDKDWDEIIKTIGSAQKWLKVKNLTVTTRLLLLFDIIINQVRTISLTKYNIIRSHIFINIFNSATEARYDQFKKYAKVLKRIEPDSAFYDILNGISNNNMAIEQLVEIMTDEDFDKTINQLSTKHKHNILKALKPYLSDEDYNAAISYRSDTEIDVVSDEDSSEDTLTALLDQVVPIPEPEYDNITVSSIDKRRFIIDASTPEVLQQFIQRFGDQQVIDGITFRLVR